MSSRGTRIGLLAIAIIVTACGIPAGEADQPTTTSVAPTISTTAPSTTTSTIGVISTGDLDVIVVPDENGEYPPDLIVTCPGGPSFPIGALDGITPIGPDDPAGMLAAIEPFLASEEGVFWPQEGWLLLDETSHEATLVTPFQGQLAFMFLEPKGGAWAWGGSSINGNPCDLQYAIPGGLNSVDWRLDPSAPQPEPESMTLQVLLTERECVSGQEIGDRLVGPQVVMTATEVRIVFAAEPPPGDYQTCQGNPEALYTVELPEPLGNRQIVPAMSLGISLEDYLP